jgi:hypothetical protein
MLPVRVGVGTVWGWQWGQSTEAAVIVSRVVAEIWTKTTRKKVLSFVQKKILWLDFIFSLDALHVSDYVSPSSGATFISYTSHIPVYAGTIRLSVVWLDTLHVSGYISPSSGATFISCTSHLVYAGTIRLSVVWLDALHVSDYISPSSGATFISCTSHILVYADTIVWLLCG